MRMRFAFNMNAISEFISDVISEEMPSEDQAEQNKGLWLNSIFINSTIGTQGTSLDNRA